MAFTEGKIGFQNVNEPADLYPARLTGSWPPSCFTPFG